MKGCRKMDNVLKQLITKELVKANIKPTTTNILRVLRFGYIVIENGIIKENNLSLSK